MNKANKITYSRFLFGIIMMIAAFLSNFNVFMLAYIIALFTDILDGYIARKLKIVTKFGKKLDIIADNFIMVCLLFGLFLLKPEIIELYRYFLFIFVYYLCIQAISLVYSKQLIFARTYIARLAAVLFPISIVVYLFFNNKILIILYCITMIFSLTEKILLQMTKSKKKKNSIFRTKKIVLISFFLIVSIIASFLFIKFILDNTNEKVCFENKCINVEVMDTPDKRMKGLMFREKLNENDGMLFIFDEPGQYNFWMKNMKISIDMVFLDENKKIIDIYRNVPPCIIENCPTYGPDAKSMYVIETKAGFSRKFELGYNDQVQFFTDK